MLPVHRRLPLLIILLLATPAAADVVILEGNETPLSGKILRETETTVRFWIRGMPEGSFVEIERSRIRKSWRDGDEAPGPDRATAHPPAAEPPPPPPDAPTAAESRPAPRTPDEVRDSAVQRLRGRLRKLVPDSAPTASLALFVALVYGTLLLWMGGRLADMEELGLPQCAVLSLLTLLLVVVDLYTGASLARTTALVATVSAEVVFWLLFVRILLHEVLGKAVLLLAFLLLAVGLTVLVAVALLSVL